MTMYFVKVDLSLREGLGTVIMDFDSQKEQEETLKLLAGCVNVFGLASKKEASVEVQKVRS
jgi:hypothetical protein